MKFTDLTNHQRSMLTMLCTGQSFNTDELGKGCNPKLKPDQAASSLLGLRDLGLVYSNQKPVSQQYAAWKASQFGQQVFMSRPEPVKPAVAPFTTLDPHGDEVVLQVICEHGPLSSADIARFLGTSSHNIRNNLANLEKSGAAVWRMGMGWRAGAANASLQVPKPFRVMQVRDDGITLFNTTFEDLETADRFSRTNIHNAKPDAVNYVVTLHKSMRFVAPVAAQVQVEEL